MEFYRDLLFLTESCFLDICCTFVNAQSEKQYKEKCFFLPPKKSELFNLRFVWPTIWFDFGRAQIRMQVDASFDRLATQHKSTQVDCK